MEAASLRSAWPVSVVLSLAAEAGVVIDILWEVRPIEGAGLGGHRPGRRRRRWFPCLGVPVLPCSARWILFR